MTNCFRLNTEVSICQTLYHPKRQQELRRCQKKKKKKNAEKVSRLFSTVSAKGSKKVILSEKIIY